MTPVQVDLVARSYARIEPNLEKLGAHLYGQLFQMMPEAQALFKGDMQRQNEKLGKAIGEFVRLKKHSQMLLPVGSEGQAVLPGIQRLRVLHRDLGITLRHFEAFGKALVSAIMAVDPAADQETLEAWVEMYGMFVKELTAPVTADNAEEFVAKVDAEAATTPPASEASFDAFLGVQPEEEDTAALNPAVPQVK